MRFKTIVIVGSGQLSKQCAEYLTGIPQIEKIELCYTDPRTYTMYEKKASQLGIYYQYMTKEQLITHLEKKDEPLLLISAINPYIIPEKILGKPKLTAINCHKEELLKKKPKFYTTKGYTAYNSIYDGEAISQKYIQKKSFYADSINEESMDYLKKILELCKKKDIKLILVNAPVSVTLNEALSGKADMHAFYEKLALEYGAYYYTFNKEELKKSFTNAEFKDKLHLNAKGAEIFSNLLCDLIMEEGV